MNYKTCLMFAALAVAPVFTRTARAADYYVATTGNDDNNGLSTEAPFATVDKAISTATETTDVIYVAPGTYATTTANGPTLKAKLVGTGETRDDVVIQPGGTSRALKMDTANAWLENVTVIGETTFQVTTGGAIYMTGGTITNCVIRNGTAKANNNVAGGNLYVNSNDALVIDCEIFGGATHKRGGNLYLDHGLVSHCVIHDGICDDNIGGNVYLYQGTISNCVIYGGSALNDGGNVRMNGSGTMVDCVISNGVITSASSASKKGANVYMDSTARMSRCRLVGGSHSGGYNGGSLAIGADTAITEDCLIEGSECGGVLFVGTSYLYNCTVVNNDNYGIWAWNNNAHVFNTVIYGNAENGSNKDWTGNMPENSSAEFLNNAVTENGSRHTKSAYPTLVLLADVSAFVDYANGDYSPAPSGALVDAGISDPRGASASATDLAGHPRASGDVDIGCYEYQKPDMTVRIDGATYSQDFAPATVTFSHSTDNSASPENVVFTYDFGDGSAEESTSALTISHAYSVPGVYTVKIAATNACDEEYAEMTYDGYARIASSTIYVTPGNGAGTFPYDTPETGYGNLKTAVQAALDGYTLLLGEGVHETVDQVSFSKALTLRGVGTTPEAVVVRNTTATPNTYYHRTLEMNNADGRIENITIENGCVRNQNGGNLRLVAGVVSNCVIRGGLAVADNGNAAGAAVELAGAATLTHCVISNNTVQGTSNSGSSAGGAIYIPYGAKNGRVSNCLIAYNTYVTSGDEPKAGAVGIRFNGSNDNTQIENNTIVANTVEGSLSDDSAGIYCTTWYGRLRNNIIVGNDETGKAKCTSVKLDFSSGNNFTYHNNITDDALIEDSGNKSKGNALVQNPQDIFKNFAKGNFTLNTSGVAVNRGTTSGLTLLPSVDLAGNPRVFGRAIDIGCYECQVRPGLAVIVR